MFTILMLQDVLLGVIIILCVNEVNKMCYQDVTVNNIFKELKKGRFKKKLLILPILLLLSFTLVSAALTDGLIGYYDFETNTTAIDSTNTVNGTITTMPQITGKLGNGIQMIANSASIADFGRSTNFTAASPFTFNVWLNRTDTSTYGHGMFMNKDNIATGASGLIFTLVSGSGSNNMSLYDSAASWIDSNITNVSITMNQWNMINYAYNGSTLIMTVYLYNGTKYQYIKNSVTTTTTSGRNLQFNGLLGGDLRYKFIGSLDEFGIWNRALTDAEKDSLYNSGAGLAYPFAGPSSYTIRGVCSYNSTALNNVTVALINPINNTIYATKQTNSTGNYFFDSATYAAITQNSTWVVSAYFSNVTTYYAKSIWVNVSVAD